MITKSTRSDKLSKVNLNIINIYGDCKESFRMKPKRAKTATYVYQGCYVLIFEKVSTVVYIPGFSAYGGNHNI